MEIIDRLSTLHKSFNSSIDSRLSLDSIQATSNRVLDVKLAAQSKQLVDLYNDQDDEGEIMLLAMILLQLHGVKLPGDDDDLLNKKKRQRTSPDQLAILEQIFQTDKMPNQQTRVQLADQLGMSSRRVQIWFQNKRAKVKRSGSKDADDCESPNELNLSSSSISPSSSPSSPSVVPTDSPIQSAPSSPAVVPQMNPLKLSLPNTESPIVVPSSASTPPTRSTPLNLFDNKPSLKAQQLFNLAAPFSEGQVPLLTASY